MSELVASHPGVVERAVFRSRGLRSATIMNSSLIFMFVRRGRANDISLGLHLGQFDFNGLDAILDADLDVCVIVRVHGVFVVRQAAAPSLEVLSLLLRWGRLGRLGARAVRRFWGACGREGG